MEIKKCVSCGAFIMSDEDLCASCAKELSFQNTVLKNYFDENASFDSISSISAATGIDANVIQKYMRTNNYIDSNIDIDSSFSNIQF